jgi:hypothetical protein
MKIHQPNGTVTTTTIAGLGIEIQEKLVIPKVSATLEKKLWNCIFPSI